MILPTKHLRTNRSLLGIGADVLRLLDEPKTISRLWDEFKTLRGDWASARVPFDWFVLAIDLLYLVDAVHISRGRLTRRTKA